MGNETGYMGAAANCDLASDSRLEGVMLKGDDMASHEERSEAYTRASEAIDMLTLVEQVRLANQLTFYLWLIRDAVAEVDAAFAEAVDSFGAVHAYEKQAQERVPLTTK